VWIQENPPKQVAELLAQAGNSFARPSGTGMKVNIDGLRLTASVAAIPDASIVSKESKE
jgi:hypothetical protein